MPWISIGPKHSDYKTFVDDEDAHILASGGWRLDRGYVKRTINSPRQILRLHRVIMPPMPDEVVDHIDRNRLNNSRSNLRVCSPAQNNLNKFVVGVADYSISRPNLTKPFKAKVTYDGVEYYLGWFASHDAAMHASNTKRAELFGEFAPIEIQSLR